MKIGIISDVHSNHRALKVCLDYFEKEQVDYYLLLGDYVSDTPYPEKVMEMIYSLKNNHKVLMVRGNREDYFLEDRACDKGWKEGSAVGNLIYTRERLTEEDFKFFSELPIADKLCLDGYPSIMFCHGSPESTREHIYMATENSDRWLNTIDTDYLIAGHTHQRCVYHFNDKTYINSGSCGIAIHNAMRAECVMLTGVCENGKNDWKIDTLSIPYDAEALVEEMFSSGLYNRGHWFINSNIQTLTTGIDRAAYMVGEAYRLMGLEYNNLDGAFPSEENFAEAANNLNIPDYAEHSQLTYIRMAEPSDAEALIKIYSYYVENTAVTYEHKVPSAEEFRERIIDTRKLFPYYVAIKNGLIIGYAYASKFKTRAAYSWDCELSIYVDKDCHRTGVGSLLLEAVEDTLKRQGIINLYAVVSDSDVNRQYIPGESINFHKKHGFIEEGRLRNVGNKFGKWFDTVYLAKSLSEHVDNPSKPQPYFTF